LKSKIWHRWVDEIFPEEESISIDSIMERLTDNIKENKRSMGNFPFKSALKYYLTHVGKYERIIDGKMDNLWVRLG
jgi:hypothetical protein